MQVTAAPFGAAAPPQPVFNASGQPAGTRDWPIGDTFTLQLSVTAADFLDLLETGAAGGAPGAVPGWLRRAARRRGGATTDPVIDVQWSVATFTAARRRSTSAACRPPPRRAPGFGAVELQAAGTAP